MVAVVCVLAKAVSSVVSTTALAGAGTFEGWLWVLGRGECGLPSVRYVRSGKLAGIPAEGAVAIIAQRSGVEVGGVIRTKTPLLDEMGTLTIFGILG